jgi:putative membrane protein
MPRLNIAHLPFNVVRMADLEAKDPRVYFAAERTFLAWIRTGLALMGFGFVVARFGLFLHEMAALGHHPALKTYGFSVWAGTALVLVGVFINLASALQHVQIVNRLNRGADVVGQPSYTAVAVALILALLGIAMVAFLLAVE